MYVAADRADAPPLLARGGRKLREALEAPVEGLDVETFGGEVERVHAETAGVVEGASR